MWYCYGCVDYGILRLFAPTNRTCINPSQDGLLNRINSLTRVVALAIVMSPWRHHFSWGHHLRWDCPLNGSQLNCHKRSGNSKLSYSSASAPQRHHFSWGHPLNWGHSCIGSQLNLHKGSGTSKLSYSCASAILLTLASATPISL